MRFFSSKSSVTAVVFFHRRGRLCHQCRGAARCALFGYGDLGAGDCHTQAREGTGGAVAPRNDKGKIFFASSASFAVSPSRCSRGFTLLEILIVTILIALIAGIGIPRFIGSLERAEVKSVAGKVAAVMRRARLTAVSEKVPVTVEVDTKSRTVSAVYTTGEGKKRAAEPVAIPDGVNVWTGHSGAFYHRPLSIEFAPTGSSTGGDFLIAAAGSSPADADGYLVRLNPLSGRTVVIPARDIEAGR